jgi:DNA modification methylase
MDKADELQEKWQVETGDLFVIGKHRLICGDCTDEAVVERVMGGEKAQMLFTDPPYGVDYTGGHFHSGDVNIKRERPRLTGDAIEIYSKFLPVVLPFIDGPCYVWFAGTKANSVYKAVLDAGCKIHAMIVWHKINATYAAMNAQYKQRHEPCLYFKPRGSTLRWTGPTDECTLWEIKRDSVNELHPTQKPVALALRAIGNHNAEIIADFFVGSGSTLAACEQLNRRGRGIEIEPKYCAVTLERLTSMGLTAELVKWQKRF